MTALKRLQSTGLSQRLGNYSDEIEGLDSNIFSKQNLLASQIKDANEPQRTSMQDAMIQAVISLAPALLGYAAAGKEGAYHGLQGGAVGGEIYTGKVQDRYDKEIDQKKSEATLTQSEISALQKRREKLGDRSARLTDTSILNADKERGKNARTSALIKGGMFNKSDGAEDPENTYGRPPTDASDATEASGGEEPVNPESGLTTTEELIYDFFQTDAGKEAIDTNPKATKLNLDIMNKLKDNTGKDLTQQKQQLDIDEKEREASSREVAYDFGTLQAKASKNASPEQISTAQELLPHYKNLTEALGRLEDIMKNRNSLDRMGVTPGSNKVKAELKKVKQSVAEAKAGLVQAKETAAGKSNFSFKKAEEWSPNPGGIGSEVASWMGNFVPGIGTVQTDTRAALESIERELANDLESLNFEPIVSEADSEPQTLLLDPITGKYYDKNYNEVKQ